MALRVHTGQVPWAERGLDRPGQEGMVSQPEDLISPALSPSPAFQLCALRPVPSPQPCRLSPKTGNSPSPWPHSQPLRGPASA